MLCLGQELFTTWDLISSRHRCTRGKHPIRIVIHLLGQSIHPPNKTTWQIYGQLAHFKGALGCLSRQAPLLGSQGTLGGFPLWCHFTQLLDIYWKFSGRIPAFLPGANAGFGFGAQGFQMWGTFYVGQTQYGPKPNAGPDLIVGPDPARKDSRWCPSEKSTFGCVPFLQVRRQQKLFPFLIAKYLTQRATTFKPIFLISNRTCIEHVIWQQNSGLNKLRHGRHWWDLPPTLWAAYHWRWEAPLSCAELLPLPKIAFDFIQPEIYLTVPGETDVRRRTKLMGEEIQYKVGGKDGEVLAQVQHCPERPLKIKSKTTSPLHGKVYIRKGRARNGICRGQVLFSQALPVTQPDYMRLRKEKEMLADGQWLRKQQLDKRQWPNPLSSDKCVAPNPNTDNLFERMVNSESSWNHTRSLQPRFLFTLRTRHGGPVKIPHPCGVSDRSVHITCVVVASLKIRFVELFHPGFYVGIKNDPPVLLSITLGNTMQNEQKLFWNVLNQETECI